MYIYIYINIVYYISNKCYNNFRMIFQFNSLFFFRISNPVSASRISTQQCVLLVAPRSLASPMLDHRNVRAQEQGWASPEGQLVNFNLGCWWPPSGENRESRENEKGTDLSILIKWEIPSKNKKQFKHNIFDWQDGIFHFIRISHFIDKPLTFHLRGFPFPM